VTKDKTIFIRSSGKPPSYTSIHTMNVDPSLGLEISSELAEGESCGCEQRDNAVPEAVINKPVAAAVK
jgi:hypothetical protein